MDSTCHGAPQVNSHRDKNTVVLSGAREDERAGGSGTVGVKPLGGGGGGNEGGKGTEKGRGNMEETCNYLEINLGQYLVLPNLLYSELLSYY